MSNPQPYKSELPGKGPGDAHGRRSMKEKSHMLTGIHYTQFELRTRYLAQLRGMLQQADRLGNHRVTHALRRLISRVYGGRVN